MPKELKPCPFCGSNAIIKHDDSCGYTVICYKCNAKSDRCLSRDLAVKAWNRRMYITNDNYNDTKVYLQKKYEICNFTNCYECPLSEGNNEKSLACYLYDLKYPEEAIAKVKAWHEKKYKKYTYRDDFLDKYPKALTTTDGYPKDTFITNPISPCSVYPQIRHKVVECSDCRICWDMEMED